MNLDPWVQFVSTIIGGAMLGWIAKGAVLEKRVAKVELRMSLVEKTIGVEKDGDGFYGSLEDLKAATEKVQQEIAGVGAMMGEMRDAFKRVNDLVLAHEGAIRDLQARRRALDVP